ncbi:MAG TPA: hypothetical protein VFD55_00890 [Candidatus Angelobacter sp.]|nr:hypothetical protein [Candidatus Angelobacter sp.]
MKDLDFDELDRAVNSLVAGAPGSNVSNEPKEKTLDIDSGSSQQTASNQPKPPMTPASVGQKSTGRFMDVVHPSSDMRSTLVMPERTSHQGVTIDPVADKPKAPDATKLPVPNNAPPAPTPTTNDWPDPIDFHGSNKNIADNSAVTVENKDNNEDADIDKISDEITNTLNPKPDKPLDSPFLSGTKVEKRPLGSFSDETSVPTSSPVSTPNSTPTAQPSVFKNTTDNSSPLPAELQDDLLLIEADSSVQPDEKIEKIADSVPAASIEPKATPALETLPTATSVPTSTTAPVPTTTPTTVASAPIADEKPAGPTSITQQYKEQPNSGDQNTGAIYDTNVYHKTPMSPTKKKPSWLWVIWIIGLLVVGAGAGAAVYFFVLPNL